MNSTIGIDNLFIQPWVNVILYTVKKIERLVQQEKKSRLLQAVIALIVRGVAHGFRKLNLLCILTYVLVLHSLDFLAFFSVERPHGYLLLSKLHDRTLHFSLCQQYYYLWAPLLFKASREFDYNYQNSLRAWRHRASELLMTSALTWCANIFVWCLVTPTFFGRSLPLLVLSIILKNKKICTCEVLIISHILSTKGQIGTWIQVCVT